MVMPSNYLILYHPLLLLLSVFPSIRVFSNESVLRIRWPEYWSFSFNISPSNEHSGLISFRMDSLDLLAVQGTLKRLLQYHSSKASILWSSAFFIVQLSDPHMTTGKTIAWTIWCKSKKQKSPGNKLLHSSFVHSPSPLTVNSFCGQQHEVLHSSEPFSGSYLSENLLTVGETCQES